MAIYCPGCKEKILNPNSNLVRIQITSLPYTISAPGTYVLTKNMSYPSSQGAAITILSLCGGNSYWPFCALQLHPNQATQLGS
jgi:hypothetical protein